MPQLLPKEDIIREIIRKDVSKFYNLSNYCVEKIFRILKDYIQKVCNTEIEFYNDLRENFEQVKFMNWFMIRF